MLALVLFFLVATLVPAQQPDVSASEKSATQQDVSNRSTEQENPIDKRDALNLNATKTLIAIVGGILGAIAFFWRLFDAFANYLQIDLDLSVENGFVIARTSVENKGVWSKRITNALLLIGPESEEPISTAQALFPKLQFPFTDQFKNIHQAKQVGVRAAIPLPSYYKENVRIGDENIGYDSPVALQSFQEGEAYSVRFLVFGGWRFHRSTQRAFVVPRQEARQRGLSSRALRRR